MQTTEDVIREAMQRLESLRRHGFGEVTVRVVVTHGSVSHIEVGEKETIKVKQQ